MSLDETSRVIGQLEAAQKATQVDVAKLDERTAAMDAKLDKLLARSQQTRLTMKHWATILGFSSIGGGGLAHLLRKLVE